MERKGTWARGRMEKKYFNNAVYNQESYEEDIVLSNASPNCRPLLHHPCMRVPLPSSLYLSVYLSSSTSSFLLLSRVSPLSRAHYMDI